MLRDPPSYGARRHASLATDAGCRGQQRLSYPSGPRGIQDQHGLCRHVSDIGRTHSRTIAVQADGQGRRRTQISHRLFRQPYKCDLLRSAGDALLKSMRGLGVDAVRWRMWSLGAGRLSQVVYLLFRTTCTDLTRPIRNHRRKRTPNDAGRD